MKRIQLSKTLLTLALVGLSPAAAYAQGTIQFLNSGLSRVKYETAQGAAIVPVPSTIGAVIGVFWGRDAASVSGKGRGTLLTPTARFDTTPGVFNGGTVYPIPDTSPGETVYLKFAGWVNLGGVTDPTSFVNATHYGESGTIQTLTLAPPSGPGTVVWQGEADVNPNRAKPFTIELSGTGVVTVTTWLAASNYALEFDGTNDLVQAGINSFSNVVNSFTIELWANPTGFRAPTAETNAGISDINQRFAVFPDHGDLSYGSNHACAGLSIGTNGVSVFEHAVNYLPSLLVYSNDLSGWTHVALVYVNRQPRLYLNGTLVGTNLTSTKAFVHPSANLGGSIHAPGLGPFQGQLDEVRIWDAPLSQVQIQANMNRSLTGTEAGLLVYYRCDEGDGTALADSAMADPVNHGTLVNGTDWVLSGVLPFSPIAQTLPASATGAIKNTLHGRFNPAGTNASAWFEWGPTTNYGNRTPVRSLGGGTSNTNLSEVLPGVTVGVTYHFRAVASNGLGVALGSNLSFIAPVFTHIGAVLDAGYLTKLRFDNIGNSVNVADLLNHPKYINDQYDFKSLRTDFSANYTNECDDCGYVVRGLFIPTATGPHTFYIAADDGGVLYLSRDESPTNKVQIAREPVWAGRRNYIGEAEGGGRGDPPANRSAPINLIAGARYYIEGAVKEATGGDNLDVAVQGPGDAPVMNGNRPIFGNRIATTVDLPGVSDSAVAWGDYDGDGRLDLLITGDTGTTYISQVWRNTGNGFTNINAGLPGAVRSAVAWGDYDNDGRLDILLAGLTTNSFLPICQIWRNTGSGFTNINAGLLGIMDAAVAWGDYDNDGRLDILLAGTTGEFSISQIWRNTSNGFINVSAGLNAVSRGSVAWGDYDNDGRLDLLITGFSGVASYSHVWRNTGSGFANVATPQHVETTRSAWGDYDNDGRLDIVVTGPALWRNTGGEFVGVSLEFVELENGSLAWGDYDNDGRLDILLTGSTSLGYYSTTEVWRNTVNGFTKVHAGLPIVRYGSAAWGDYDNDGRLDVFLTGQTLQGERISQIWRNHTPLANTPPSAPTGLRTTVTGGLVTFTWNAATDSQTPSSGLTYSLRAGTTPGGHDLVSPMAASSGLRRLPQMGTIQPNRYSHPVSLPPDQPIYWSVQAVDSAFAGSAFAAETGFRHYSFIGHPAGLVAGDSNFDGVVTQAELDTVLANYFPNSPFLKMTNVAGLGGTNVTFALTNDLAGAFRVEVTTNLLDWLFLGPATPRYEFTDTNAPANSQRYYRLRWP